MARKGLNSNGLALLAEIKAAIDSTDGKIVGVSLTRDQLATLGINVFSEHGLQSTATIHGYPVKVDTMFSVASIKAVKD